MIKRIRKLVIRINDMKFKKLLYSLIFASISLILIQVIRASRNHPMVLLWWTPFTLDDREIFCNDKYTCLISGHRDTDESSIKAYLFYGSNLDIKDLPKQKSDTPWALYHEESPKNLHILRDRRFQNIFEITSTFSRYSTIPLTLQYLMTADELKTTKYYTTLHEKNRLLEIIAPVLYLQSDCETPIYRDEYVKELMKYVKVDSYGACLNNKELPDRFKLNGTYDLYEDEFMKFVAKYKFIIAIENSRCFDYITEKLWRPLIVGSIPIYLGSPTVKDWLPNNKSAILIDDFPDMKSLADYINKVNKNDALYMEYLVHKTENKVSNKVLLDELSMGNFGMRNNKEEYTILAFECNVCKLVHESSVFERSDHSIYDCDDLEVKKDPENIWISEWKQGKEIVDKLLSQLQ